MKRLLFPVSSLVILLFPIGASAQLFDRMSNPKVTVTVRHAPGLGLPLAQLAFAPPTGRRADEIVDALQADFVRSGMRVVDRRNLQSMLAEHQLNYSGYVDPQTAMQMGRFLAATALLVVDVSRATTEHSQTSSKTTDSKKVDHITWHSKTKAYLRVSIQTVDLKTGQLFQAEVFDKTAEKENTADEKCCADYPADFQVFDLVMQQVIGDAHRLFVVWDDPQQLYFFDDKDCRMNVAYDMLKSGDMAGADRQSADNLETCKATPKINEKQLAHAYYNIGALAFLQGRFDRALDYFEQAQKVKDIGITTDAMAQLKKAQVAATELAAFERRRAAVLDAANAPANVAPAPDARSAAKDSTTTPKASPAERLKALESVYKQGLITKEEYEKKRAEILREM